MDRIYQAVFTEIRSNATLDFHATALLIPAAIIEIVLNRSLLTYFKHIGIMPFAMLAASENPCSQYHNTFFVISAGERI